MHCGSASGLAAATLVALCASAVLPALAQAAAAATSTGATADRASITVHVDQPGIRVSPTLYGIFFEDINLSADGGIYAEMVRNRSLEDGDQPTGWTLLAGGGAEATMAVDRTVPLNDRNPRSLRIEVKRLGPGRTGVANGGFWGMAVRQGATYNLSLCVRCDAAFKGPLAAVIEGADGKAISPEAKLDGIGPGWKQLTTTLKAAATDPAARLVITVGSTGTVWLDMVSLFPRETWKGRPNGLRPDLAGMLADLAPGFVRFPGGCWVEGETLRDAYRWKNTLGDPARRSSVWNLWQYTATNGLGYHEYLQMCEDLGAEALFVVNCGMSHRENVPMAEMGPWVQDALDAIEYAVGPADSRWGAERAKNGHPAPFNLNFLEIGNENGGPAYQERYALFHDAIKAKYPAIRLVADAWNGTPRGRPLEIIDEHYYSSPEFFIANANKYDSYDRSGPRVYVGEYAVTHGAGQGNLRAAVGEAAFMTGMERNSDVVVLASYAPLFANVHHKRWNPDLICFDNSRVYGTPSYYVQQMFARNRPDVILATDVSVPRAAPEVRLGAIGLGTWSTQAEFKGVRVAAGDKVLFASTFADGTAPGWKIVRGNWRVEAGAYRQTGGETDLRAVAGDPAWREYTLTLKARKIGGAEGFLIMFNVVDDQNFAWWNLGGWGNARHAIEVARGGGKTTLGSEVAGRIDTDRWYDIRIEVAGGRVRCFLDGRKVHDVAYPPQAASLFAVAGRDKAGDVIVKVVNAAREAVETDLNLAGAKSIAAGGQAIVLTSANPADENSLDNPRKVAPQTRTLEYVAASFRHTFPGNSVTVLRLKAE